MPSSADESRTQRFLQDPLKKLRVGERVSSAEAGSFIVATLACATVVTPIAFNLGAHHTIFYQNLLLIWMASIVSLLASVFVGKTREGESYFTWWGALLLGMPTIWFFSLSMGLSDTSLWSLLMIAFSVLVSFPYILWVTMAAAIPDTLQVRSPRLIIGFLVTIISVASLSFITGLYHPYILTCSDFTVSGDFAPANCTKDTDG